MQLSTRRLQIDRLSVDDADALFACRGDPRVARFQGWCPANVAEAADFIRDQNRASGGAAGSWFQRAIRRQRTSELIGDLGVHVPEDADGSVEFGISIAPEFQRSGYAGEALHALFGWAFGTMGRHRLQASVDPGNLASIALLRSVGMRQEAHFRESLRVRGEWVDDVIFAMLSREWFDQAPQA